LSLNQLDETSSASFADEYVKVVVQNDMPDNCALSLSEVKQETPKDKI
jgi:hypothetical protein